MAKQADDYHKLAKRKGWKWLGPLRDATEKTKWQCDKGHKFDSTYWNTRRVKRCPVCWGRTKLTEDDYTEFASNNGITFLGPLPQNSTKKANWRCEKGHTWQRSLRDAKKTSHCPTCNGKRKTKRKSKSKPEPKTKVLNGVTFRCVQLESAEQLRWHMIEHKERKLREKARRDMERDWTR